MPHEAAGRHLGDRAPNEHRVKIQSTRSNIREPLAHGRMFVSGQATIRGVAHFMIGPIPKSAQG